MAALDWLLPDQVSSVAWFLLVGSTAAVLIAMAKAGFGGSVGLLSTPMMIMACDGRTRLALGIMLPLLMVCDLVSAAIWWRKWNWRAVALLLPGAILGIAAGWATMHVVQARNLAGEQQLADAWLKLGVGIICLIFVGLQVYRARGGRNTPFRPVFWQGSCIGATAGFTSMMAHAAGPITSMYLLSQRMEKGRFVASTILFFWIGNALKLGPYWHLGLVSGDSLGAGLLFVPAVVAGTPLGLFLHHRVGRKQFTIVVYTLLTLAGGHLIWKAVRFLAGA